MSKKFSKNELKKMNNTLAAGSATNASTNDVLKRTNARAGILGAKSKSTVVKAQDTVANPGSKRFWVDSSRNSKIRNR